VPRNSVAQRKAEVQSGIVDPRVTSSGSIEQLDRSMVTVLDAFARIIHARVRNAAIPGKLGSISICEFVDERYFHADESGSFSEESLTSRVEEPEATRLWPRRINIGNCPMVLGRGTSARDGAEGSERPRKSECRSNMNTNGTGLAIGDTLSDIRETRRRGKRRRQPRRE